MSLLNFYALGVEKESLKGGNKPNHSESDQENEYYYIIYNFRENITQLKLNSNKDFLEMIEIAI